MPVYGETMKKWKQVLGEEARVERSGEFGGLYLITRDKKRAWGMPALPGRGGDGDMLKGLWTGPE